METILGPVYASGRGRMIENGLGRIIEETYSRLKKIQSLYVLTPELHEEIALALFGLKPIRGATASNATETDILALIFNATTWANVAINATSSPATNIAVALHTADPGETGTQSTSEAAYGSYARVNVARNSGGWTVGTGTVSPVSNITFPTSSGSGSTITYFSVGHSVSNYLFASGSISPSIPVGAAGVTPILTTSLAVTCD